MSTPRPFGFVNRLVAAILSLAWGCGAVLGLSAAFTHGRWMLVLAAAFALWFSVLWARVAYRARRLTWQEALAPWRTCA